MPHPISAAELIVDIAPRPAKAKESVDDRRLATDQAVESALLEFEAGASKFAKPVLG